MDSSRRSCCTEWLMRRSGESLGSWSRIGPLLDDCLLRGERATANLRLTRQREGGIRWLHNLGKVVRSETCCCQVPQSTFPQVFFRDNSAGRKWTLEKAIKGEGGGDSNWRGWSKFRCPVPEGALPVVLPACTQLGGTAVSSDVPATRNAACQTSWAIQAP